MYVINLYRRKICITIYLSILVCKYVCMSINIYIYIIYNMLAPPPKPTFLRVGNGRRRAARIWRDCRHVSSQTTRFQKGRSKMVDLWGGYHIATPRPKIYHVQLFVDVKEVVFAGNLFQKQSRHTITFKKNEHILRSESTTFLEGSKRF